MIDKNQDVLQATVELVLFIDDTGTLVKVEIVTPADPPGGGS